MNDDDKILKKIRDQIKLMIDMYAFDPKNKQLKDEFNKDLEFLKDVDHPSIKSLMFRKEKSRGFFDFFWDIYTHTKNEQETIKFLQKHIKKQKRKIRVINNGVDNEGYPVILNSEECAKCDYLIDLDKNLFYADLKIAPLDTCITFKLDDLKRYVYENIHILLVILKERTDYYMWGIVSPDLMLDMLNNKIGERGFHFNKYKPTQRIWKESNYKGNRLIGYNELVKLGKLKLEKFNEVA